MASYYILMIVIALLSGVVAWRFRSKFNEFSQVPTSSGLSGKEIAEKMLRDYGISNVQVVSGEGMLTDHYDPSKRRVSLSPDVYNGRTVAAAAVAAHECGHAVQHAKAYSWLQFRSFMVPAVSGISSIIPFVLIAGILTVQTFPTLLLVGVLLFALTTLFSFVTLPVEFDASARALKWLEMTHITHGKEHQMAKSALKWAAMTYVVAAISSLATLLYYASFLLGGRRSEE